MKPLLILSLLLLTGCGFLGLPAVVSETGKTARVAIATTGAVLAVNNAVNERNKHLERLEQAVYDDKRGAKFTLLTDKIAWIIGMAIVIGAGVWLARGVIFYWIDKRRRT